MASLATAHTLELVHTNICPINDVLGCVTEQRILNITNKKRTKCPEISICIGFSIFQPDQIDLWMKKMKQAL